MINIVYLKDKVLNPFKGKFLPKDTFNSNIKNGLNNTAFAKATAFTTRLLSIFVHILSKQSIMKKITLLLALLVASFSFGQIVINEVDADQTGTDATEFIELLGAANSSVEDYVVVLFNGSDNLSYNSFDLTGTTDANGFYILGSDMVAGADIVIGTTNVIQNGADAIAIYTGSAADWPNDSPITTTGLIDAIVYGTNDGDDVELLTELGETVQYNEDANNNNADTESLQRRDDGTYCTALPTVRGESNCSDCALLLDFESAICDAITDGTDTVTYTINFTGGGSETVALDLDVPGSIGGDDPSSVATGTITVTLDEGIEGVLSATGATCDVSITLFATSCIPATTVATIAELRALDVGTDATLTGEAVLTFQQDFRNQKFIEDATGAILIDDSPGTITTTYAIGDGISGIAGTVTEFGGMLQFSPSADPGAATSTGNAIVPQEVTAAQLAANPNDYESEYVELIQTLIDVTVPNWENGTEYALTTPGGPYVFRTSFFDVDYIGQAVPTTETNIAGIVTERNDGDYFITARDASDITDFLSIDENTTATVSLFPNPANSIVTIQTTVVGEKQVQVYDLTGKMVINTVVNATLDVSKLSAGMYILQTTQDNKVSTAKLIIN